MRTAIFLLICIHISYYRIIYSQSQYSIEGLSCTDENSNRPGKCIAYRYCEIAKRLYVTQRIRPTICGFTSSDTIVCCPTKNQINRKSISEKKCEEYADKVSTIIEPIPFDDNQPISFNAGIKCSLSNNPLIVGGQDANLGEFPHMAAIGWLNSRNEYDFMCGGSLISENFVLTAAHCTFTRNAIDPRPRLVRIGDHDLKTIEEDSSPQDIDIADIILHPQYKAPLKYNDIALLRLVTFVRFNNYARPACLWRGSLENDKDVIATGWGKLKADDSETSNILQKVTIKVVANSICNTKPEFQNNRKIPNNIIDTQLCAGVPDGGKDTCQGDSGGPLQFTMNNKCIYYIAGITSFGISCGRDLPGIYTRVSKYVPWIEKTVWPDE